MATITPSSVTYYYKGNSGASWILGYDGTNRVVRIAFTTDSMGASSISVSYTGWTIYSGTTTSNTAWHINQSDSSYANARVSAGNYDSDGSVTATYQSSSSDYTLSISSSVALLPNTTYYLWLYPKDTTWQALYNNNGTSTSKITITTTPARSTVKATSAVIGSTSTITISRYSSAFTHTLTYTCGSYGPYTIATKTSSTSVSWKVTDSTQISNIYKAMGASKTSVSCTVTCTTYSGSTSLGSSTCTATLYANDSANGPTLSATFTLSPDASSLTGSANTLILNYHTVAASISATAKNSATVSSISLTNGSKKYSSNSSSLSASVTATSGTFSYSATDSRGYSASGSKSFTTVNYIVPTVSITANPPDPETGACTMTFYGKFFNGSFGSSSNSISVSYSVKNVTDSTTLVTGSLSPTTSGSNANGTYTCGKSFVGDNALDYTKEYLVSVTVVDSLSKKASLTYTLKCSPSFYWNDSDFYFNADVHFNGDAIFNNKASSDYIVGYGSTDTTGITWYWRKWNSGYADCWGLYTTTGYNMNTTEYSGFYYGPSVSVTLPFTFATAPVATFSGGNAKFISLVNQFGNNTTTTVTFIASCLFNSTTAQSCDLNVHVIVHGRWK